LDHLLPLGYKIGRRRSLLTATRTRKHYNDQPLPNSSHRKEYCAHECGESNSYCQRLRYVVDLAEQTKSRHALERDG
jgi:hypothetical protein